MRVIQCWM